MDHSDPLTATDLHGAWLSYMRRGDFAGAWAVSARVLAGHDPATRDDPRLPYHLRWVWDGRPFAGRHVLVRCYHGLGDTLMFARFLPLLRRQAASVTLECQAELVPLLDAMPGIDHLVPFDLAAPLPPAECDIEIMELSFALRASPGVAPPPYLQAPPSSPSPVQTGEGGARGATGGVVGVVNRVSGGAHFGASRHDDRVFSGDVDGCSGDPTRHAFAGPASAAAAWERGLAAAPDQNVTSREWWIGLCWQVGSWDRERVIPPPLLQALAAAWPCVSLVPGTTDVPVGNPEGCPAAVADTAALIDRLDLVITVDTMVAHLAGALGRPTWLLLKHEADWRWMDARSDSPWYPSVRLYRQAAPGDWAGVMARVWADLARLAPQSSSRRLAAGAPDGGGNEPGSAWIATAAAPPRDDGGHG